MLQSTLNEAQCRDWHAYLQMLAPLREVRQPAVAHPHAARDIQRAQLCALPPDAPQTAVAEPGVVRDVHEAELRASAHERGDAFVGDPAAVREVDVPQRAHPAGPQVHEPTVPDVAAIVAREGDEPRAGGGLEAQRAADPTQARTAQPRAVADIEVRQRGMAAPRQQSDARRVQL